MMEVYFGKESTDNWKVIGKCISINIEYINSSMVMVLIPNAIVLPHTCVIRTGT